MNGPRLGHIPEPHPLLLTEQDGEKGKMVPNPSNHTQKNVHLGNIGNQLATNNQVSLARLTTTTFLGFTHEYLFRGESLFHICHYEKFVIASSGVNSVDMK